jgi:hypothetical protein
MLKFRVLSNSSETLSVKKLYTFVKRWYTRNEKPHPRYLECGFIVTPTESLFYGNL